MKPVDDILTLVKSYAASQAGWERSTLLAQIELACTALLGQERQPDEGPWSVSPDGKTISSDNFDHDVQLQVNGDFYGDEDRRAYSVALANRLNGNTPLNTGLPKEPPAGLLYSMAMRYRHDFGLLEDHERQSILIDMRRLYDEVAGHGFFDW